MPYWSRFPKSLTVSERRARARRHLQKLRKKKGAAPSPLLLEGRRTIAKTFWGKAWCDNIESYRDLSYRLERGRSYVRHNGVIDLVVDKGQVRAQVSGSRVYKIVVDIDALEPKAWRALVDQSAGQIDSMVSLLQGRFSEALMAHFCAQRTGLFPTRKEIRFACSCPDYASVCKHVAAVMYGVGARLDESPELLFRLRDVDESELLRSATAAEFTAESELAEDDLADLFGIELDLSEPDLPDPTPEPAPAPAPPPAHSLLDESLMVALIAALLGAESWEEAESFAAEGAPWLRALLPLEGAADAPLPSLAPLRALIDVFDAGLLDRWRQALVNTASRRYRPDNRLRRGLPAARKLIPRLALAAAASGQQVRLVEGDVAALAALFVDDGAGIFLIDEAAQTRRIQESGASWLALADGALAAELVQFFEDAEELDFEGIPCVFEESTQRAVWWVDWADWVSGAAGWEGLRSVVMVEEDDAPLRYYLSSAASALAGAVADSAASLRSDGGEGAPWLVPLYALDDGDSFAPLRDTAEALLKAAKLRGKRARQRWRKDARTDHRALLKVLGA